MIMTHQLGGKGSCRLKLGRADGGGWLCSSVVGTHLCGPDLDS